MAAKRPRSKKATRKQRARDGFTHSLTDKEYAFVWAYAWGGIGTEAAIEAGYAPKRAHVTASELLHKPKLQAPITAARAIIDQQYGEVGVTKERIKREVVACALGDPTQVIQYGPNGVTITHTDQLTPAARRLIAGITETTTKDGGTVKVMIVNKLDALRLLAQIEGMLQPPQAAVDPTKPFVQVPVYLAAKLAAG